jgi:hypothetical protein
MDLEKFFKFFYNLIFIGIFSGIGLMIFSTIILKLITEKLFQGIVICLFGIGIVSMLIVFSLFTIRFRQENRKRIRDETPWWKLKEFGGWI